MSTTTSPVSKPAVENLALNGGPKAQRRTTPPLVRWGQPEIEQLTAAIAQPSLFYWNGAQTNELIKKFQEHYPLSHVMACSSGSAAIHIAVAAAGVGFGDEVITTPVTDTGTLIGILYQQAVPVFADVDPHNCNLDVNDVRKKITKRTKAIVAVHLTGNPCALDELRVLADEHNLVLIEDCAQAWGAKYKGRPVGTVGHIGCFSLNDFKHIGCGDGGIVASNIDKYGESLQRWGDKGYDRLRRSKHAQFLAPNYRISELQSAVGVAQFGRLKEIAAKRNHLGLLLQKELAGTPGLILPNFGATDFPSFWFYLFRIDAKVLKCDLETFCQALNAEGVPVSGGYIIEPIYKHALFATHNFIGGTWPVRDQGATTMDYTKVKCAVAEDFLNTCVRVSITQAMDDEWIIDNARGIKKVAAYYL